MNLLPAEPEFEVLLDYLKHNRGCDLTGYKRSPLVRRFWQRMQSTNISSYQDYLQYLQSHDQEWMVLLNTVLINVTGFFRDRDAWDYLANEIVPKIIGSKQPDESIRVWSAGCASGQEVYSLLILFAEALGIESCLQRVQFYATDVDEAAIKQAHLATYEAKEVTSIPPNLLEKYFEQIAQGYVFHRQLRRQIVFGHHNLVENAPMSKIDLLSCRNVLIYFTPETQASIFLYRSVIESQYHSWVGFGIFRLTFTSFWLDKYNYYIMTYRCKSQAFSQDKIYFLKYFDDKNMLILEFIS